MPAIIRYLLRTFPTTGIENNSTTDLAAPTFLATNAATAVAANGTSVALKFNENLSGITDSAELRDQFAIKVNGVERATTAATLSSDTLTFTLSTANKIASSDVVTIEYAQASSYEIKDAGVNTVKLADFSATAITNSSNQDLTAPIFDVSNAATQVVAGGDIIELKFSEDLTALATTAEARGQFVVKVGGVTKTVSSAALKSGAASIVQLTMAEKIAGGVDVEVAYTQHSTASNNVVDAGNNTVSLANFATTGIENNSTTDLAAPTFLATNAATAVAANSTSVALKFNENLSGITDSAELRDQFAIKVNGVERATTAATLSIDTLTFTLSTANKIASGDVVTIEYAQASSYEIKDSGTNTIKLADFSATAITNSSNQDLTAPTFDVSNAATQVVAGGDIIELKFSEDLTALATTADARGQFVVKVGGVTKTVSSAALKSGSASIIQLTMADKIAGGVDVEVAYTQHSTASNNVVDAGNNTVSLANFATTGIENNSTTDLAAPTFLATNAATAVAANSTSVALKFNENLSGITDSAELRDQFAIKVNGVERATTAATLSSDTLTFTLSTANKIASGDVVTIEYAQASSYEIKDAGTNTVKLADFSATAITNSSNQDLTAPTFDVSNAATQVVAGGDIIEAEVLREDLTALATTADARGQFVCEGGWCY